MSQSSETGVADALVAFLDLCAKAAWTESLWFAAIEHFQTEGFDTLCYQHLPPLGAPDEDNIRVASWGYPKDWEQRYIGEKLFRTDPMPAQALTGEEPFRWGDIRQLRDMTPAEKSTLDLLEGCGRLDGIAVPVFGPGGRNGYFGLGVKREEPEFNQGDLVRYQAACQAAHLRYCRIVRTQMQSLPVLSTRERELLGWVARGKSNSVIAEIMNISPHTVDAYLRRVFYKLGTTDRISAVVKALGSGLIRGY
ncbi:helix-turn-helix transcriptional regulator [Halovulum sp. GXIMD14794]